MASVPREPQRSDYTPAAAKVLGTCLLAFCLLGFGQIGAGVRGYLKTGEGVKTTAQVKFFKVSSSSGTRGGGPSAKAEYEYSWKGQRFHGDRIGFLGYFGGSEARLQRALQSGEPIEIFIDPSDPSYSVVDRTWNWAGFLFYAVLAIACGAGAIHFYRLATAGRRPPDDSRQIRRAEGRRIGKESREKNGQAGAKIRHEGDEGDRNLGDR